MARNWFAFNGTGNDQALGSYTRAIISPEDFCEGGSVVCAIYAQGDGASPTTLSQNIRNYIIIAKATRTYYPTMDGRPFVYTRP
jgi:hypothetical protein